MEDSISARGFAKQIGKSHVWVLKLVKEGVIPRNEDGTIPLKAGLEAYMKTQEGKGGDTDVEGAVNVNAAFNKVKLAKETYSARLKELDYKARKGELLERDQVCAEAAKLAENLRGKLFAIPVRVSGLCEGRTSREIEEIIENAINEALKELQKCEYL